MEAMCQNRGVRIGKAGRLGRGVFATRAFKKGDLLEQAPLLAIEDYKESFLICQFTKLGSYVFEHGDVGVSVALGTVSFCNHSFNPNAFYILGNGYIRLIALRAIKRGEQVKINYNGDPCDDTPINFKEWNK